MSLELLRRLHKGPHAEQFKQRSARAAFEKFAKGSDDPIIGFEKWVREIELIGPGADQLRRAVLEMPRLAGFADICSKPEQVFVVDRYEKAIDGEYAIGARLTGRKYGGIYLHEGERRDALKRINTVAGFDIYRRIDERDPHEPALYRYLKIGDALIRVPHDQDGKAETLVHELRDLFFDETLLDERVQLVLELIRSIRKGVVDSDGDKKMGLVIAEPVAQKLGVIHRPAGDHYDGLLEVRQLTVTTRVSCKATKEWPTDERLVGDTWSVVYDKEIEHNPPHNAILVITDQRVGHTPYFDAYFSEGLYSSCFFNERKFATEMLWI